MFFLFIINYGIHLRFESNDFLDNLFFSAVSSSKLNVNSLSLSQRRRLMFRLLEKLKSNYSRESFTNFSWKSFPSTSHESNSRSEHNSEQSNVFIIDWKQDSVLGRMTLLREPYFRLRNVLLLLLQHLARTPNDYGLKIYGWKRRQFFSVILGAKSINFDILCLPCKGVQKNGIGKVEYAGANENWRIQVNFSSATRFCWQVFVEADECFSEAY